METGRPHPIRSLEHVLAFLEENEGLIDAIREAFMGATHVAEDLSASFEAARETASELLATATSTRFEVNRFPDVRKTQRGLIKGISRLSKKIERFADHPRVVANLRLQRSAFHMELANTYNDQISNIIPFSTEELDILRDLLNQSALDTASRLRLASILRAASNLSRFIARFALNLTV